MLSDEALCNLRFSIFPLCGNPKYTVFEMCLYENVRNVLRGVARLSKYIYTIHRRSKQLREILAHSALWKSTQPKIKFHQKLIILTSIPWT